ncbi:RNA 3'-terminal phosphate cyclase [Pseudoalteromonas luteoviolacea]|uniref:RNA 3'-terminal phosphate cyclase n=1 Tax=Pseudoalteromonas luteoviolacea TaxID=43657 RepID=UPI00114F92FF|nr:RNA 3'-terminal phosphate cyclase [Pseudoalteromonas luteoviolacea]TQF68105.1 RNA 3'-terminal phosphate cyclase [Pseudoalteromonas luteoviolacea]
MTTTTNKPTIIIDGSKGEGGGQVLRTALSLSMLLNQPIEIKNIRAGRKKPGLKRQHLTCVLAAQQICDAQVTGAELNSQHITFTPNSVQAGNYEFEIGTAGSTVLVCQTILLPLALSGKASKVKLQGGTHNGMSPSLTFLERSFMPALKSMGLNCKITTHKLGFFPAGGGSWQIDISPLASLKPCQFEQPGAELETQQSNCHSLSIIAGVRDSVANREIKAAQSLLGWSAANTEIDRAKAFGNGNSFHLSVGQGMQVAMFEQIGELGLSAERVAGRTVKALQHYLRSGAAVEEHLADQLLLPIALAGGGSFTTSALSSHTTTNINVIAQLSGIQIKTQQLNEHLWKVYLD